MRSIVIGIIMLAASIVVGDTAKAQGGTKIERGHVVPAPVGHRQPSENDVRGDDQFAETGLAKVINEQNRVLDRALKGICRGC
jgi:hypothetical protein